LSEALNPKKIRTGTLLQLKAAGQKISALTSYDHLTAEVFDQAGIEILLVGDSAGNTVLGQRSTLEISVEEMISFGKAVASAAKRALVVVDMPFGSYEVGAEEALSNAIRIMKGSMAEAVKLEGARIEQISAIVSAGIPVMGHIGFTPQSVHTLGGFKVQGRGDQAQQLMEQALAIQQAGAFAIVLEMVPASLAGEISQRLSIPTIGIGAGNKTDGQILVWQDFAGLTFEDRKFVRKYLDLRQSLAAAAKQYLTDVQSGDFPASKESFAD
jgi:3-methyl-2-oxobutanoate hydroxymethyltransferase